MNLFLYGGILVILNHLIISFALNKLAKTKKIKMQWLSFVPIGNLWILGKVIESFKLGRRRYHNAEYRLITASLVCLMVSKIPIVNILVGIAYSILVTSCAIEFSGKIERRNCDV